jgi:two-component system, OmpR family, sensor histidine kinase BaeS
MVKPVYFGIGKLGLSLAIAFLGVAVAAIVVMFWLNRISTGQQINQLVMHQEKTLSKAVTIASGMYGGGRFDHEHLAPLLGLVAREGAAAEVRDSHGAVVEATPGFAKFGANHVYRHPVVSGGRTVGSVVVKFGDSGLGSVAHVFEEERLKASMNAAIIVALVALVVSLLISRHITMPLERLLGTIRARGAGDRSARTTPAGGTGVISELAVALNESNDAIDQRERLHKNLMANIAHELRTPVAILQASHEAMIEGVTPRTTENLWSLRDEVLRLARMIDDLQRLAAAEAAALQLKLVSSDVSTIAADAAASLSDPFSAAGVSLIQRLNSLWIMCDPDRMREVVVNLLTNALKFTPTGGRVVLETGALGRGRGFVRVSDTGIGIPSDELPRVTERFFRGQRSSEMATGSGIGLTIVAELARAQHADLSISSEPGKGTQATITFPSRHSGGHGRRRARARSLDDGGVAAAPGLDRVTATYQNAEADLEDQADSADPVRGARSHGSSALSRSLRGMLT